MIDNVNSLVFVIVILEGAALPEPRGLGHDPFERRVSSFIKLAYECTVSVVSIPFFRCSSRGQYAV